MKIQVLSDLHTEMWRYDGLKIPKTLADVIVLAGDISVGYHLELDFCATLAQDHGKPVVFVLGNHSYYERDYAKVRKQWMDTAEEIKEEGVIFLDDGHFWKYQDTTFTGGTLWTNFNDGDPLAMDHARQCMNDFHIVRNSDKDRMLIPQDTIDEHEATLAYIDHILKEHSSEKNVVVTHHLPSEMSVDPQYKGDLLNAAFMTDLDMFIGTRDIDTWIHGHTHASCDYMIEDTRVVCNPYGYHRRAVNRDFEADMVVEI